MSQVQESDSVKRKDSSKKSEPGKSSDEGVVRCTSSRLKRAEIARAVDRWEDSGVTGGGHLHGDTNINRVLVNCYTTPLDQISVNPFVNHWRRSWAEVCRVWSIGALMTFVRIVPMIFIILFACLFAKVALIVIALMNRCSVNSEPFRLQSRNIAFKILRVALFFAGFYWIRVIDKRRDKSRPIGPIIPVAPHSSFFDLIVILKLQSPTFVSRSENQYVPLFGNVLRLCKGIYVTRSDKNSRANTLQEIRNRAVNGDQVLIFPEGTCTNRNLLAQFKMGAFIPKLPVQPVIVRWDAGDQVDVITWSWEGPGAVQLFLNVLARISTNCEITILPEYSPNNEEKANPRLFADNVSRLMCSELGVLQSFYSYDDVPLLPIATNLRLFRSPACICFLKMCHRIQLKRSQTKPNSADKTKTATDEKGKKTANENTEKPFHNARDKPSITKKILGVGEDVEHPPLNAEMYVSKNFSSKAPKQILAKDEFVKYRQMPSLPVSPKEEVEFQYLPISGARRRLYNRESSPVPEEMSQKHSKQTHIYSTFCRFIEHCLTHLEANFEFRVIESSEDLIGLIGLKQYVGDQEVLDSLRLSSLFMDLLKILEYSVHIPVTTVHLLAVLHLCDIREHSLWQRLEAAHRVLAMQRQAIDEMDVLCGVPRFKHPKLTKASSSGPENLWLSLTELRTLLWYSLGLQEYSDQFFFERKFTSNYLRTNLTRLFRRACIENGSQLLADE